MLVATHVDDIHTQTPPIIIFRTYGIVLCRTTYFQRDEQSCQECLLCNGRVMLYCATNSSNFTTYTHYNASSFVEREAERETRQRGWKRAIHNFFALSTMISVHEKPKRMDTRKESHRHFSFHFHSLVYNFHCRQWPRNSNPLISIKCVRRF